MFRSKASYRVKVDMDEPDLKGVGLLIVTDVLTDDQTGVND